MPAMADDLRAALDEMNRKYGPERTWAGGIPCSHERRTDECEWCSPETDIRYALAEDLERMGLWPNEDREYPLADYDEGHLPYNPITDRYETGGDEIELADEFYDGDIDTP